MTGLESDEVSNLLKLLDLVPEAQALMHPERPASTRMSMATAVHIASFSKDVQQELALEIASRGLRPNSNQSKILVRRYDRKVLSTPKPAKIDVSKDARLINSFISRTTSEIELLLDLPEDTFVTINQHTELGADNICYNLTQLCQNIDRLKQRLLSAKHPVPQRLPA